MFDAEYTRKLGDLPGRAQILRMTTCSHQKRSLARKGAGEKREASYKWRIMTAKKKS